MSHPTSRDILADLVAFDTTSRESNLPLIAYVEAYLARHGVESRRIPDETGTKANLWATIGPEGDGGVILSGHTDTVPCDGQTWTGDPYTAEERDGRLYGRGTCDMKGFIACVLAAVPDLVARGLSRPVHLAFTYDEEVGCLGAKRLLEVLAAEPLRPAYCIVGEPTLMQVTLGHKAKRSMRVRARGLSCHSSLAPQGVNALDYAARMALEIRDIAADLAREGARDTAYDVPHSTAHTGVLSAGTALNIVPDLAEMLCEFRVLPQEDPEALVARLAARAESLSAEMRAHTPECGIELEVHAQFPGLDTDPESEIAALAKGWARRNDHGKVAFGTEGGRFHEMLGVATVICGPGSIVQAHKPDEFIALDQLAACDAFLSRLAAWAAAA